MLMGPSGSGKSSLIKTILGFHGVQSGKVMLNGEDITYQLPEKRRMGYVPQNYALFPHLNVEENLRFGMRAQKMTAKNADRLLDKLVKILNIENLRTRRIHNLSGGEQQRVALGRALGTQPRLILLDEPFSSIDEGAKRSLWFELKSVVEEVGITTLHITHNLDEACTLGGRLSVLIDGQLVQQGSKDKIFEQPNTEGVARYLNYTNIFTGTTIEQPEGTRIDLDHFSVNVNQSIPSNVQVKVCIRQQDIKIIKEDVPVQDFLKRNIYSGTIIQLFPLPESCLMWFKMDDSPNRYDFELKFPLYLVQRHNLYPDKKIRVALWEPSIILFDKHKWKKGIN
jgi:ABC-type Fe3+/spermidine/putrescine transport system ATPase subunit